MNSTPVTAAAWFEVVPHLHGQAIGGADVHAQGYVASAGNFLYYPALSVDSNGKAAMVMTLSGTRFFPSAAYAILQSGQSSFGGIRITGLGTGPYDPNGTRWGDYSWAVLDPNLNPSVGEGCGDWSAPNISAPIVATIVCRAATR